MEKNRAQQMRASVLAAKPLVRQVVPIYYADPTDLMARIQELGVLSPRGKITLTQSTGKNTINDGESKLRPRVREDLVVSDVEEHVLQATEWIRKLDVSDGQVMIEARIVAITDTGSKQRGLEWSGPENLIRLVVPSMTHGWNMGTTGGLSGPETTISSPINAIITSSELSATLHALDALGNTEVLSHPLVVLGNRTEGQIEVTTKYPVYTKSVIYNRVGDSSVPSDTYNWEEIDIGLTLWVCPEISPDGKHIRLSLNKIMDDKLGDVPPAPDGSTRFQIAYRSLDTRAVVRDGDTLVVGGLIRTQRTIEETRIPILASIPGLGRLFRYDKEDLVKENLVIMITPTILKEEGPSTGYEPASRAKADELSALGTDYFYKNEESKNEESKGESLNVEGQGAEDGKLTTEDGGLKTEADSADSGRKLDPLLG